MSMSTAATSSSASVAARKPPVSTSMLTGRKPRKRLAMRATASCGGVMTSDSASFIRVLSQAPRDAFARPQRDQLLGTEWVVRRHLPRLLDERGLFLVPRQAVEVCTELGREPCQPPERACGLECLRVQLDTRMRREDPGTSAGRLFRKARVRRAVRPEKEPLVAARDRFEQGAPVELGLQHRQAVVVRPQAAVEQ